MGQGFFSRVQRVIDQSDIVLEVLDARFPELTRNHALEQKVLRNGKRLILVLNKSDFVSRKVSEGHKSALKNVAPCVFVSAPQKKGMNRLKELLNALAGKEIVNVGVIGFPNTGKSSVINALAGRHAARVSAQAGFTKGEQWVNVGERIRLLDTPGVIPQSQWNEFELALVGSKNPNQLRDVEGCAMQLIQFLQERKSDALKKAYGVNAIGKDADDVLEEIAIKKNRVQKGGKADTTTMSKLLWNDWLHGRIKV